jgi:hypothetical protein
MLKVIADQLAIKKHVRQFAKKFKPFIDEKIKVKLGHQGASFPAKVLWSKRLGIWLFAHAIKDVRYWNAFGMGKPEPDELVSITAEINFPWSGVDRKTGGTFARDAWGNVFVIHRGKIGGGKKGVGKSLFEHNYRGVWAFMEDGDGISQVAVIGALQSPRIALQIAQFVKKIELLKIAAVQSSQTEIIFPEIPFREDLVGSLPLSDQPSISAECDHDLIISSLAALLKRWKFRIGNDENHELFCVDPSSNKISHVFEVITDNKEKSIMAAAAKLFLQIKSNEGNPFPILILPEEKMATYAQILQKIGIATVGFRVEEERIIFPDLVKIRLDQNQQL